MSQPIQTPNVGTLLTEFFRLVGTVRPELEEIVIPTVIVGDLSGSAPPVRRRHAISVRTHDAAAANFAHFELRTGAAAQVLPADKNTIAVVTRIQAFVTATDQLRVTLAAAATLPVTTLGTRLFSDQRLASAETPQYAIASADVASVLGSPVGFYPLVANQNFVLDTPGWVIRSPGVLLISNSVADAVVNLGVEWDEYQLP